MSRLSAASQSGVPAILVKNVSKNYGTRASILSDLNFTISAGEFVSIIGPSGCGKSTLLKLIAGLTPVSHGTITIDGMTPANARETMSFIFQDPTLLPWRTVRANVGLGLELEHASRDRHNSVVNTLLTLVGLSDVAASYPRQLSGGMKMRVSIARALASQPRVLLLDEPFAALDEITRDRMNEEIVRLHNDKRWTACFVTHSISEAVFLSTRILILAADPGRLQYDLSIGLPFPREADVRQTDIFEQTVAEVSRKLRSLRQ